MSPARKHYDELIARNERAEREARGETFRDLARTTGHLALWVCVGLSLLALALHSTSYDLGRIFWLTGHVVWIAGVSFSLLACYRRGVVRGDWT